MSAEAAVFYVFATITVAAAAIVVLARSLIYSAFALLFTFLGVAGLYVLYHMIENYYIGPKVYGDRLRLSNLAVILAFAVGAEIGGVVGALLALPFAALYPVIERVWLREYLTRDAVETHRRLEQHGAGH